MIGFSKTSDLLMSARTPLITDFGLIFGLILSNPHMAFHNSAVALALLPTGDLIRALPSSGLLNTLLLPKLLTMALTFWKDLSGILTARETFETVVSE